MPPHFSVGSPPPGFVRSLLLFSLLTLAWFTGFSVHVDDYTSSSPTNIFKMELIIPVLSGLSVLHVPLHSPSEP